MTMAEEAPARVPVTPSVLREARVRVRLEPERATEIINKLLVRYDESAISAREVQAWEQGVVQPTVAQAEALARAYLLSFITLFQAELPPPNVADFRRGPKGRVAPMSYETCEKLNLFSRLCLAARRAWQGLGLAEEDVHVPRVDIRQLRGREDIEELASEIRVSLGISDIVQLSWTSDGDALREWRGRLEGSGVSVLTLPMNVEECRGASLWEPGGPPAILVNTADETTAQLFTLAHEYAHLMFGRHRGAFNVCDPSHRARSREEQLANQFAAAALMPRTLILSRVPDPVPGADYSEWPRRDRRRLRDSLKVSSAAIGIRLRELGLISDAGPHSFWRKPSRFTPRGVRRPDWLRYRSFMGPRAMELVREAVSSKAMSATEVARILDLKVGDVEEMLG